VQFDVIQIVKELVEWGNLYKGWTVLVHTTKSFRVGTRWRSEVNVRFRLL